jgi:heme/copper-type cytochrome/quinol oxidase subunit 2
MWVGDGTEPDESTGGGGKKGGGHPNKKREVWISLAVIFAAVALVIILVVACLVCKCRRAKQDGKAGPTNPRASLSSIEIGTPK